MQGGYVSGHVCPWISATLVDPHPRKKRHPGKKRTKRSIILIYSSSQDDVIAPEERSMRGEEDSGGLCLGFGGSLPTQVRQLVSIYWQIPSSYFPYMMQK
jgi:hypothetical protein